jgi:hypothetical protein
MSARFSYLTRRRRNWLSHAKVRSTTQRQRPNPLPCIVLRFAKKGEMRRVRRPCRIALASYPRSPKRQSGRRRGRPLSPCNGGSASTSGRASCESFRLAAVKMDYEWHALSIADQVTLATRFSSVRRIGTGLRPPKTARTEQLSTTARDQSISR